MGEIMHKPLDFTNSQIATIRRSVAAEANDIEFDTFINMAREYGLNPFKKQLHLIVYNRNDPKKRKVAIFPSRDGFRALAAQYPGRCHLVDAGRGQQAVAADLLASVTKALA